MSQLIFDLLRLEDKEKQLDSIYYDLSKQYPTGHLARLMGTITASQERLDDYRKSIVKDYADSLEMEW